MSSLVPVVAALVLGLVVIRFTDLKFLVAQHVLGVRDAQSVLVTRRSIRKFKKQAVPEAIVGRALAAAILAPNHWVNEPWRFHRLGPSTIEKLLELNPEKRASLGAIPGWLVVSVVTETEKGGFVSVKGIEDHAATACATQNFMLSLAAAGVGSKWLTGALQMKPDDIMRAIGAPSEEKFLGIITFGYADEAPKAPNRKLGTGGGVKVLP